MMKTKIFMVLIYIFKFTELITQRNPNTDIFLLKEEKTKLKYTILDSNESYSYTKTIVDTVDKQNQIFLITTKHENSSSILKVQRDNFRPLHFSEMNSSGNITKVIHYTKNQALISDYEKNTERSIKIDKNTYHKSSLTYLFRKALIYVKRKEISVNLIMEIKGWGLQKVKMYAKTIGEENISTPLGLVQCFKIELGVAGLIGELFWRTKYYYYFLKESPHYFIKYSDPGKEEIELLDYKAK